jgi:hypothetical protein
MLSVAGSVLSGTGVDSPSVGLSWQPKPVDTALAQAMHLIMLPYVACPIFL